MVGDADVNDIFFILSTSIIKDKQKIDLGTPPQRNLQNTNMAAAEPEQISIEYNRDTFNLENPNDTLVVEQSYLDYQTNKLSLKKPVMQLNYDNICIKSNNVLHVYVILQHIMKQNTLIELSKCDWDYNKWKVEITSNKKLPDWANILNCILNLGDKFNKPLKITDLDAFVKLNDKRGWGGERPREVYYKMGYLFYTPRTNQTLNNGERLIECPFPIGRINPKRKAIVSDDISTEKKCFTCGCKEGETSRFGNVCTFEKGHFNPHILGGEDTAGHQCKWCNSFYKDKLILDPITGKPDFNVYAVMRDSSKSVVKKAICDLNYSIEFLTDHFTNEQIIELCKKRGITPKDLE